VTIIILKCVIFAGVEVVRMGIVIPAQSERYTAEGAEHNQTTRIFKCCHHIYVADGSCLGDVFN